MEVIIVLLLSISIILYIVSFFTKDNYKKMEQQIENLSLSVLQENYQIKKKLKILEEELLLDDQLLNKKAVEQVNQKPITTETLQHNNRNRIINLSKEGHSREEIAKFTELPIEEVRLILDFYDNRGRGSI